MDQVLSRIKVSKLLFRNREKRVAEYILHHSNKLSSLSISQLAERSKTSPAAVFRFCRRIGYQGYRDLKNAVQKRKPFCIPEYDKLWQVGVEVPEEVKRVLKISVQSMSDTLSLFDHLEFKNAVQSIAKARCLELYGGGGSGYLAGMAYSMFRALGINASVCTDHFMQRESSSHLTPQDAVMVISHSGTHCIEALISAKKRGAKTICIVAFIGSPLTQIADITLCAAGEERLSPDLAVDSRIATLFLIDALFLSLCRTKLNKKGKI